MRAIYARKKGRDLYDLWYLVSIGAKLEDHLVKTKMNYYRLDNLKKEDILRKIKNFNHKDFILDLRPFVPLSERDKLPQLLDYLKDHLARKLKP